MLLPQFFKNNEFKLSCLNCTNQEFLLLDEVNGEENSSICSTSKSVNNWFIRVDHLTAQWPQPNAEKSTENTLTHLSFTVRPGQLLAVIGQVGAGKVHNYNFYFFSAI